MDLTVLKDYGIDYEKGLKRCLDDHALYETILGLFLQDDILERSRAALSAGDYRALFSCMHELKGASGNAEITDVYLAVCPLVELLREGDTQEPRISEMFAAVESACIRAKEGILTATGY